MDIRNIIVENLIKEIVGPNPNLNYLDPETGEERLLKFVHGSPLKRYGASMLYPKTKLNIEMYDTGDDNLEDEESENDNTTTDINSNFSFDSSDAEDLVEEPISLANQYYPSAMGFTVRFSKKKAESYIQIKILAAKYIKGEGQIPIKYFNNETNAVENKISKSGNLIFSDYWTRRPFDIEVINIKVSELLVLQTAQVYVKEINSDLEFCIYNRTTGEDNREDALTFTFVIINKNVSSQPSVDNVIFQASLKIITSDDELIIPYKEKSSFNDTDEERQMNLLYRDKRVFGIGHGSSVKWKSVYLGDRECVSEIETAAIPQFDINQIAPTSHVELIMYELSDYGNWNNALQSLLKMCNEYDRWIDSLENELSNPVNIRYQDAIQVNINKCKESSRRIRQGFDLLANAEIDSDIVNCFRWMNRTMLWQQQRSKAKIAVWQSSGNGRVSYSISNPNVFDSLNVFSENGFGRWRPFQLAFILMNLNSIVDENSSDRSIVDLIWFPTGGGKTEAYLGLSAFTIFYRRLIGTKLWKMEHFGGTTILMRYTLRLLTTHQYERAASLICACEVIRKEKPDSLGNEKITLGLWVGGETTPNDNDKARAQYNSLNDRSKNTNYNFVVMKCPCCGTQIGKVAKGKTIGLKKLDGRDGKIIFNCENNRCEFYESELPLKVVDEYIYDEPPTMLLATVDKFAMIPWKKEAGKIFGFRFDETSESLYRIKPPDLIIQDELHLISGPLGTMVGLYETMVQTLCNNYNLSIPPFFEVNFASFISPKIVASSATISRAYDQVKALYGIQSKEYLNIFPAQGIKFGETWFSEEKDLSDALLAEKFPARRYVGIMASGYPSAQTAIVRAYASVLQSVAENARINNIDYYWTLVGYFNSIRELGGARSLLSGDIVERLVQIQNMNLVPRDKKRRLYQNLIRELTSQMSSSDIPKNLKDIEISYSKAQNRAIDVCLATNMLATGVDISRLGLMFIHGQPKTTAEYIQASSRVGRDASKGPGLIFTLYSPAKPRDKSQYEQFQAYHSRIYSNVEPTSITPFSINARSKALHAVIVGLARHFASNNLRSNPVVVERLDFYEYVTAIKKIILDRVNEIDANEKIQTENSINSFLEFWMRGFQNYGDAYNQAAKTGATPLMYSISAEVPDHILINKSSKPTPTSMRGVDTESVFRIV